MCGGAPLDRETIAAQVGVTARQVAAVAAIAASVVSPALADETAPDVLANACAACHGTDGMSPGAIPTLQGLSSGEIETMLSSFRSGELEGTVMNRIAKGYTDLEIKALARYFGSLGR